MKRFHPDIHSHLPANPYLLARAATPAEQELERMRITVTDVRYDA